MKKIGNKDLICHLNTSNFFTEEQCGLRRNHSTIDTLVKLHTDLIITKYFKQHLCLFTLDIEKAYNMAWCIRIFSKIQKKKSMVKYFSFCEIF